MTTVAKVITVNISSKKGVIKHPVPGGVRITELGIEGDAHAGDWHRQVSLLGQESIDKMTGRGAKNLEPGIFAENITTEGIDLFHLPLGTRLVIGEVELEVTQIGKECHTHCQVYHQVGMCVMPIEGIFARVIRPGFIKPGDEISVLPGIRAAVITISDRGSAGEYEDRSGPALVKALEGKARVLRTEIIPDELKQIKAMLIDLCDSGDFELVFTTGGTGFAPRDVTPEATLAVIERETPGISEAIRQASLKITPRAMLSRAAAGIRKNTLIVNFPGSPKAAVESLESFLPVMTHAVEMMHGGDHVSAAK